MKFAFCLVLTIFLVGSVASDKPTLLPASPFDSYGDAKTLHKAIEGWGTDEAAIINVLCHRVGTQRAQIATTYLNSYNKNLINDLIGDLSGNFKDTCVSLTYTVPNYLSIELQRILTKKQLDPLSVQEVLISRSTDEIAYINTVYGNQFKTSLRFAIESKFAGSSKLLLSQLSEGARIPDSNPVDPALVSRDVTDLYNAGQGMAGTNEAVFVNIFAARSFKHLNAVYSAYASQYGYTMESVIRSEFTLDIQELLLDIVQYSKNKATYLATRLFQTMDGAGTRDHSLIRLIISRCETDLGDVKSQYENLYSRSLSSHVSSETSGDYRKALLQLIA